MSGEATHPWVQEFYGAYQRRDFDHLATLIHDDIDWIIYAPIEVFPFAGPRQGRAAVLRALGMLAENYALDRYELETAIVEGDRVAVLSNVGFTQRSTNRVLRFQIADFIRVRDKRLVEFREFINTFDLVEQALGRWLQV